MLSTTFVKTQLQRLNGERKKERLGGTLCGALYSSEISTVKKLDTSLIFCNKFVKTQLQKLKGEKGEEADWVPSRVPNTEARYQELKN